MVWNWYHFVAITILNQPRPTDSADINTRMQLSDTSSIQPMHGGFLLVSSGSKELNWTQTNFYSTHALDGTKRYHDDVIKWKHFPRYWAFVRGIHRSPVKSPNKGQWRGALMFSLTCARINDWVNDGEACDLRRHPAHCDVIVMMVAKHLYWITKHIHNRISDQWRWQPCQSLFDFGPYVV